MVRKTTLKSFSSFLITYLFVVSFGFGQSIFNNPIEGTNPGADNPYTTGKIIDNNITVSGIGRGPGVNMSAATNDRYNATNWNTLAFDSTAYFEFTITPNSGFEIDFVSFAYTGQASIEGPTTFAFRSSLDSFITNIGSPTVEGTTIDLWSSPYQNIVTPVTFRIYGWGGSDGLGTFSINDFTFNGNVRAVADCAGGTTTWDGTNWIPSAPDLSTKAIINGNYNTNLNGNIIACSLIVNPSFSLNVSDDTFVEIQNDVDVFDNGNITIETNGAFVQNDYTSTFTVSTGGTATVNKTTKEYSDATLHYVYWSSPIASADLSNIFPNPYLNRRYYFESANFVDVLKEDNYNNNTFTTGQDDIDDDNDAWKKASGMMEIGHGYTIATDNSAGPPYTNTHQFTGELNNGNITVPVFRNDTQTTDTNWILLGNPYPSAIDATAFIFENYYDGSTGTIEGPIYVWNSEGVAVAGNPGFDTYNFSQTDYYDLINLIGGTAPGPGLIPISSGQGFFVSYHNDGVATSSNGGITKGAVYFNNVMRIPDDESNSNFYKNSNVKGKTSSIDNKLWVRLTSDNGVFNQILIGYLNIATDNYDGEAFDASKNLSSGSASIHSIIPGSDKKFIIQGKAENSLGINEIIKLGFDTNINVATLYTLSIAQLQGDFLTNNTIYLKDNLLETIHNLSDSDYTFTSEVGEFNDRFVVMFNNESLSTDELELDENTLNIIDLNDDQVQFTASNNLKIKKVSIFDLLGRELYQFEGQNNTEIYNLSNLKHTIYIAKVELSNGAIITKKAIKK